MKTPLPVVRTSNQVLVQACQDTFPATAKPPAPKMKLFSISGGYVLRLDTLLSPNAQGASLLLGKLRSVYHLAAKKATKACHAKKRQENFLTSFNMLEDAAQQGDQRKVYQMVKKLALGHLATGFSLRMTNGKLTTKKRSMIALSALAKLSFPRKQNNLTEMRKSFP